MLNKQKHHLYVMALILVVFVGAFMIFGFSFKSIASGKTPGAITGFKKVSKSWYPNIDFRWNKAKNATEYQLGMKKNNGKWFYVRLKNNRVHMTDVKLKPVYFVKIRAVNGNKYGKWMKTYRWSPIEKIKNKKSSKKVKKKSRKVRFAKQYIFAKRRQYVQLKLLNANPKKVKWRIRNTNLASISKKGVFMTGYNLTANIEAIYKNKKYRCTVYCISKGSMVPQNWQYFPYFPAANNDGIMWINGLSKSDQKKVKWRNYNPEIVKMTVGKDSKYHSNGFDYTTLVEGPLKAGVAKITATFKGKTFVYKLKSNGINEYGKGQNIKVVPKL